MPSDSLRQHRNQRGFDLPRTGYRLVRAGYGRAAPRVRLFMGGRIMPERPRCLLLALSGSQTPPQDMSANRREAVRKVTAP